MQKNQGLLHFIWSCIILNVFLASTDALICYKCTNLEFAADTSYMIKKAFAGETDPNCKSHPSKSSKSETCSSGDICGFVSGELSANVLGIANFHAKMQMRGCFKNSYGTVGTCKKPDSATLSVVNKILSALAKLSIVRDVQVDGEMCSCDTDYCVVCDNGVAISGVCVDYWIIGVSAAGLFVLICLIVLICCCCCDCCRCRSRRLIVVRPTDYRSTRTTVQQSGSTGYVYQSRSSVGYQQL